jgi:hypothetical protein
MTVIVPLAVVPRPFSANTSGARVGDATGLLATVGDGEVPVLVDPQATVIKTRAVSTTNLLNLGFPDHLYPPALPVKVT